MPPQPGHHEQIAASAWVERFAHLVPAGSPVLDVAAGGGRHSRFFTQRNHPVVAADRDTAVLNGLPGIEVVTADLENGNPWPLGSRRFGGVIVTNYLHRPILPAIVEAVAPGGALLYETFAVGNERFGKPSNPDFLLRPGELLETVRGRLRVVAYEDIEIAQPKPAMVQRIAAINEL
jgi:SAM-dependent methyltransferase